MRIRNSRYPYWFPMWVDGEFRQGTLGSIIEFDVEEVPTGSDDRWFHRFRILTPMTVGQNVEVEFIDECFEILQE